MPSKCMICKTIKVYPICKNCRINPFNVERCRQMLADIKDINILRHLYEKSYSEIKDINASDMWDEKFEGIGGIKDQDGMTRDRIKTAFRFLPNSCKKVLDIGAGAGFLEEYLIKRREVSIYANDFSDISIHRLRNKFNGNFEKQSIYKLKYPNNFFDCIFLLEVLEHVPPSKVFNLLGNVKKMLKKKGYLIVSVPMNEGLEKMETNPNAHVRDYSYKLIKAELELAGFNILKSKKFYAFDTFYQIKKLISRIFFNKWRPNNIIILAVKS